MTHKQKEILDFIRRHRADLGRLPTLQTIATQFNVSKPTIHEHLQGLVRLGFLREGGPKGCAGRYVPVDLCPTCGGPLS